MITIALADRLNALAQLGDQILIGNDYLDAVVHRTAHTNSWFTKENQYQALQAIARDMLNKDLLLEWVNRYESTFEPTAQKQVGLVLAGNIPLVGFHDWLAVFVSGHHALVKLSDKDAYLLPGLLHLLGKLDERIPATTQFVEKLSGFDAVIATGSNNSARYFEAYFGKYPHIIRRNRNAVGVLSGKETAEDWEGLAQDIFQFFGLGCRNVSKLYVPEGYTFEPLLEYLHTYNAIVYHEKYKNNFDYQLAMDLLNKAPHLNNGCLILHENEQLASPIATVHFQYYHELKAVEQELEKRQDEIQCVVAREGLLDQPTFPFGKAQHPALWDYADGADTLSFLEALD